MDFLELVQRLASECGTGSSPTTCQSQTGEALRLVNWINQSWRELQNLRDDWDFMRSSFILGNPIGTGGTTFPTTSGVYSYPLGSVSGTTCLVTAATFGKWDPYSFRCYTTTNVNKSDEQPLEYISFEDWKDSYEISANRQVVTRPFVVAIGPDKSVNLGPPPNGQYTIEGDFWVKSSLMSADDDVPVGLPEEYDLAIVYRAMKKYARFESAPEVLDAARADGIPMEYKLLRNYTRRVKGATMVS